MHIGIDLMGGDRPPPFLFEAVLQAAEQTACRFLLFATQEWTQKLLSSYSLQLAALPQIAFHTCRESIDMEDHPVSAVRAKKNSSMVVGMQSLKQGSVDALISAGNTGALVTAATLLLPKMSGILRAALLAVLPTKAGRMVVIDVGGSLSSKSAQLLQFAAMGIACCKSLQAHQMPAVGLLNVGREAKKGSSELQRTYVALQKLACQSPLFHFAGNIEGRDAFNGCVDVLLTDGFTGNIFLKTAEGTASFMLELFCESLKDLSPALKADFQQRFSYTEYPGAILCGLDGLVIKCHGETSTRSVYLAIMGAARLIEQNFICNLRLALNEVQAVFKQKS